MALIYRFEDFELNSEQLELRRAGTLVRADALVLRLLRCLAQHAGRLVSKDELVAQVWEAHAVADNAITVAVARLRKTLGKRRGDRPYVSTLYGRGYRLECDVTAADVVDRTPPLLARVHDAPPPFVGRERVLLSLARALKEACEGRGGACVVIGEPGIGKSRVVEELGREVRSDEALVAWGYCRESGDTPPLDPWLRILREITARTSSAVIEQALGPAAVAISELLSDRREDPAPGVLERPPFLRGPARHRIFDNLTRAFAAAATEKPWVFILEDIHRADAASLEFLSYLLDELRHTRLLVIATARPQPTRRVGEQGTTLARVLGHSSCQRFSLERLGREHVDAYVGAVLGDADRDLAAAVFAKSEGNAFFMAELCRQLRAADRPQRDALSVPVAALDLIWQPISQLDPHLRAVLSAAAVLGRSFELSRLQAVLDAEPGELMSCLDEALATELLIAAPGSMTAFAFGHELLRNVLYDSIEPAERRRWHLRIGQVLERCRAAGEPIPPSELAHHSYAALPESDPRKTIEHCRAAALAAGARFANADVVRYMRHALETLELIDGASVRLRMNLLFTTALYARGCEPEECVRALNEVLRLAAERGDTLQLVRAACLLNVNCGYKPLGDATPPLRQGLEQIGDSNPALRATAVAALAAAAPQCFSGSRSRALFQEAAALAREVNDPRTTYAVYAYKLWVTGGPADAEDAAATLRELEVLARDYPKQMPMLPLDLSMYRMLTALQQGDLERANTALECGAARAKWLAKGEHAWHIDRARVLSRLNAGQCSGVLEDLARLQRKSQTHSVLGSSPFCAFDRTVIARELEGDVSSDAELRAALAYDATDPPSIWSMKVRSLAAAGSSDEALALLRAVPLTALADLPCDANYLGTLGHLARAALLLGARDYMAALYPLLARFPNAFAVHISIFCEGSVAQLLGSMARALGRRAEAPGHLERAITLEETAGFTLCAARSRLELARFIADEATNGRTPRAKTLAREAQTAAQRMGARRLATDAGSVLRQII
ncbi:MAG TPA: AAA family ATPase [Polyangiales bacterium]|nr:AAA family ATPase [Polyangiales bacterium]